MDDKKLVSDLLSRLSLNSRPRLLIIRELFVRSLQLPDPEPSLRDALAEIDAKLRILDPNATTGNSEHARDVADELGLSAPGLLEFLSEAEELLKTERRSPDKVHKLMVQAAGEYELLIEEVTAKRRVQ